MSVPATNAPIAFDKWNDEEIARVAALLADEVLHGAPSSADKKAELGRIHDELLRITDTALFPNSENAKYSDKAKEIYFAVNEVKTDIINAHFESELAQGRTIDLLRIGEHIQKATPDSAEDLDIIVYAVEKIATSKTHPLAGLAKHLMQGKEWEALDRLYNDLHRQQKLRDNYVKFRNEVFELHKEVHGGEISEGKWVMQRGNRERVYGTYDRINHALKDSHAFLRKGFPVAADALPMLADTLGLVKKAARRAEQAPAADEEAAFQRNHVRRRIAHLESRLQETEALCDKGHSPNTTRGSR